METRIVYGCEACQFHGKDDNAPTDWCELGADTSEVEAYIWDDAQLPESCPLRKGPITFKLGD